VAIARTEQARSGAPWLRSCAAQRHSSPLHNQATGAFRKTSAMPEQGSDPCSSYRSKTLTDSDLGAYLGITTAKARPAETSGPENVAIPGAPSSVRPSPVRRATMKVFCAHMICRVLEIGVVLTTLLVATTISAYFG